VNTWFGFDPLLTVGAVMLLAILAYALLAGADFGGGIWDLLATGPRQEAHRTAIAKAMGPVWEANHVWIIFLLVILFTVFPPAFKALSIAFFGLFHFVLVGIVLRGAAFVFRASAATAGVTAPSWRLWTPIFGAASLITPFLLGVAVGAVSGGGIRVSPTGEVSVDAAQTWFSPVTIAIGLLTVALCAYLAAVYLSVETHGEIQEDFRRRSLWAGGAMILLSALLLGLIPTGSPHLWEHLTHPRSAPPMALGVLLALLSALLVYRRQYRLARMAAVAEVVVLLSGWAFGHWPYLIYPDLTVQNSAAAGPSIRFLLNTLPFGLGLLIPSLWLLFRVFKGELPERQGR